MECLCPFDRRRKTFSRLTKLCDVSCVESKGRWLRTVRLVEEKEFCTSWGYWLNRKRRLNVRESLVNAGPTRCEVAGFFPLSDGNWLPILALKFAAKLPNSLCGEPLRGIELD